MSNNLTTISGSGAKPSGYGAEFLRLEAVTVCVGFDDLLDITLGHNHPHLDHMIVVTSHDDAKTQMVARKHSATCVLTDLFKKNGRNFNKGAAINAGFDYFQYHGWRLHVDSDIVLPDNFRRVLFNHTHLETGCLYGTDRVDVVGATNIDALRKHFAGFPQHRLKFMIDPTHGKSIDTNAGMRFVSTLQGYVPLGYFQLWHASCHKLYPYSLGSAAHDDLMFSQLWPLRSRRLLPSATVYHLCPHKPKWGENWDGKRSQPRLKR